VTYTFSAVYQGNVQAICETTAQEVSHALGLDHEYLCEDPMTYLFGCGPKTFQDQTVACGEDGPRACACGGQQNSVQALLQVLGPADQLPPNVDIDQPAQGATVSPGFSVVASASDNGSVTKVELLIDGSLVDTRTAAPYTFSAPTSLAAGAHSIEVRATDNAGKSSSAQVSVNLQTGGGGDGGGGDGGGGNGNGSGDGDGDGSGNGDGSGGGANDDGIGDPPQVFGGCSAAGGGSERRGTAALLLVAAALLLAWRRRA
jgi:MYXO-CTERM domain-containing protein